MVNIAELNKVIESSGVKKEYLAKQLGISRQSFSLKVNGKRPLTFDEAEILINELGIKSASDKARIFFANKSTKR